MDAQLNNSRCVHFFLFLAHQYSHSHRLKTGQQRSHAPQNESVYPGRRCVGNQHHRYITLPALYISLIFLCDSIRTIVPTQPFIAD